MSSHSAISQSLTARAIAAAVSGALMLSTLYEQLRMPTSTFQASSTCSRISSMLDAWRPTLGRPGASQGAGRGAAGYAVSVGPLNADVEMYSRQCALRYGKSAWTEGTLQWMSVSITGLPEVVSSGSRWRDWLNGHSVSGARFTPEPARTGSL